MCYDLRVQFDAESGDEVYGSGKGTVVVSLAPGGAADDLDVTEDGCYPNPGDVVVTFAEPGSTLTFSLHGALTESVASPRERALIQRAAEFLTEQSA